MFKHSIIRRSLLCALLLPGVALAEDDAEDENESGIEVSGYIKNETAAFVKSGQVTGEADSMLDNRGHDTGDLLKFENSARIFINGELGEESSWHGELNLIYDTEGVNSDYRGHNSYTQNDWLRELYIDTSKGGWDFRLGKQQVVWGTADGIKLLDIINPTDYREMVQNTMEDSRIPVWMINAEREIGESGNIQFVISEAKENKIPGLNADGDADHAFIMKGVDSITGRVNGFFNIAPALAGVADTFDNGAQGGAFDTDNDGTGDATASGLTGFSGLTVDGFASNIQNLNADNSIRTNGTAGVATSPGATILNNMAQDGLFAGDPNANSYVTNLVEATYVVGNGSDNTFEYMSNATFATFNTFAGNGAHGNTVTRYVRDYPDDIDPNAGFRFKKSLENGFNFSVNYSYHYDANPVIKTSWHDAATGEKLTTVLATSGDFDGDTNPDFADPGGAAGGTIISRDAVPNNATLSANGSVANATSVLLSNSAGQYYGSIVPNPTLALSGNGTELRFTESLNRVHSLGGAFDYAFDTSFSPIVVRGEFLYDADSTQAVVNKKLLAIGDLEGGLTSRKADYFKYVLGADITVLTNMMVSAQFIQFRNLDYVDNRATCTTQSNAQGSTTNVADCSEYTGDMATMHLTNGMKKAKENKEFYSLFFSKPFGPSQEHRWNNIIMYEEDGGWWNRFDVEYSFTDELIGSAEWNQYWGDEDTQFGQFHKSSNLQVGMKYIF